jgi:hypothetical protein
VGFSPQLVDIDGDGNNDIISGSYWPGDIFIFRGKSDGTFEKGVELKDSSGRNLNGGLPWESENTPNMQSLASVPFAFDHDGDGDLDMLVGNIEGTVTLIENEGTKTDPKFSTERPLLQCNGGNLKVEGDSGPIVTDWDGDGLSDLVVGAGDGAVVYFRNVGSRSQPQYAAGENLISGIDWMAMQNESGEPTRSGMRAKVCATDYNNDGTLDLLVGDFSSRQTPPPDLSAEDIAKRDELQARQSEVMNKLQEMSQKIMTDAQEAGTDPNSINWAEQTEYMQIVEEYSALNSELAQYTGEWEQHGWVWVYLRKADA